MSPPGDLNGFKAAARILHWLEAIGKLTLPIDLELVRRLLPDTPFGRGAVIKEPAPLTWGGSEGALVRNPANETEWGIFYHPAARPERRRFTIAHELGHFVLHRERYGEFNCSKEAIYSGLDSLAVIEREADEFAGNLLMPGNLLRQRLADRRVDLHLLSALAHEFGVSLEALCIRFVKYTAERALLLYWDHGYLKYQWPSTAARRTRVRLRPSGDPAEPPPDTVAADATIAQEWAGVDLPAASWCVSEAPDISLRELKHSYPQGHRVLSLLLLEAAPPPAWHRGWEDEATPDSVEQFPGYGRAGRR